jgi:hypothetical protein
MISFSKLGEYGRFGNQLFQYVFLRTQAKRLNTQFYCPPWKGDDVFVLRDHNEKCSSFTPRYRYKEDAHKHGFNEAATRIHDGTDVEGYFQTDKFFKKEEVLSWLSFNESLFDEVRKKYTAIDFSKATALHVRLGDYLPLSLMFYTPKPEYFKNAITHLSPQGDIIVFSEDVTMAKKYLGEMPPHTIFIEGNKDYEDFNIMSLCKNIVISSSSFSWWAAYLNKYHDKKIIMPKYWFLPSCRVTNNDIYVKGWTTLPAHRLIRDNYYYRYVWYAVKKLFTW